MTPDFYTHILLFMFEGAGVVGWVRRVVVV